MILYVITCIWFSISVADIIFLFIYQPSMAGNGLGLVFYVIITVVFGGLSAFFMEQLGIELEQKH